MGDTKRKRKLFSRPKKPFDRLRMDDENVLVKRYGLKNKREIWKAKSAVSKLRRRAKALIGKDEDKQTVFFEKLNKMGLGVSNVSDVLALTEENLLDRRLQTFLFRKKMANTVRQARQFIVHKNVLVDGKVVNIPSFVVTKDLEGKISVKVKKIKEKKVGEGRESEPQITQIDADSEGSSKDDSVEPNGEENVGEVEE